MMQIQLLNRISNPSHRVMTWVDIVANGLDLPIASMDISVRTGEAVLVTIKCYISQSEIERVPEMLGNLFVRNYRVETQDGQRFLIVDTLLDKDAIASTQSLEKIPMRLLIT